MKSKKSKILLALILVFILLCSTLFTIIIPLMLNKTKFEFNVGDLVQEKALYPTSHGGRNYYIAADGKDDVGGADGTIEKPYSIDFFRWLSKNSEEGTVQINPGDQILLKRGDVFDKNLELKYLKGTPDNPITIASYGNSDKRPLIDIGNKNYGSAVDNAGAAAVILNRCSNIVVRDLEINIRWTSRQTSLQEGACGIIVDYNRVGNNKYENVYVVNNIVHSECIEEGKTPYDANTSGIRVNSYEESYETMPKDFIVSNVYVTNNLVYNLGRNGIVAHGWVQDRGVQMKFTCLKNIHLDNNIIHDVGTIGMYAGAATGCTMNRNLIYNTGMYVCADGEDPQEGEGGLMSMCLKDGEIKYNVTYNNHRQGILNDGIGIDIDWNSLNIVVQYNYVYGCDGSGIGTMANNDSKIINNRVFNNQVITNHPGQISVCDFVPFGDKEKPSRELIKENSPTLLGVCNLEIAENLISAAPKNGDFVNPDFFNKSMFYVRHGNGECEMVGNSFHDNRVVYTGDGKDFYYNLIVNESSTDIDNVTWDRFYSNKYFAKDLSTFTCFDQTKYNRDIANGTILVPYCTTFDSWSKRDIGSTFEKYNPYSKPSTPSNAKVEFKDGKLYLKWNKSSGDIWHYNIYKISENEDISYRNMLDQTKSTSYNFTPEEKGTFFVIIEPENNMGIPGSPLKLKITLK